MGEVIWHRCLGGYQIFLGDREVAMVTRPIPGPGTNKYWMLHLHNGVNIAVKRFRHIRNSFTKAVAQIAS